jgi:hypothetical protein
MSPAVSVDDAVIVECPPRLATPVEVQVAVVEMAVWTAYWAFAVPVQVAVARIVEAATKAAFAAAVIEDPARMVAVAAWSGTGDYLLRKPCGDDVDGSTVPAAEHRVFAVFADAKLKVPQAVVGWVSVDVMHRLFVAEWTTQVPRHDETML